MREVGIGTKPDTWVEFRIPTLHLAINIDPLSLPACRRRFSDTSCVTRASRPWRIPHSGPWARTTGERCGMTFGWERGGGSHVFTPRPWPRVGAAVSQPRSVPYSHVTQVRLSAAWGWLLVAFSSSFFCLFGPLFVSLAISSLSRRTARCTPRASLFIALLTAGWCLRSDSDDRGPISTGEPRQQH